MAAKLRLNFVAEVCRRTIGLMEMLVRVMRGVRLLGLVRGGGYGRCRAMLELASADVGYAREWSPHLANRLFGKMRPPATAPCWATRTTLLMALLFGQQ